MSTSDLAALWHQVDADDPRLPLVTLGEARAVVALLASLGEAEGERAALARHVAAAVARRLPAAD